VPLVRPEMATGTPNVTDGLRDVEGVTKMREMRSASVRLHSEAAVDLIKFAQQRVLNAR
jgi:hypothetical protein